MTKEEIVTALEKEEQELWDMEQEHVAKAIDAAKRNKATRAATYLGMANQARNAQIRIELLRLKIQNDK